jgi:VTC domain
VTDPVSAGLSAYAPIALEAFGAAQLLDRFDVKFVAAETDLVPLLAGCAAAYDVLEIAGERQFAYETTYWDDPELRLFRAHVGMRPHRCKIRTRRYAPSGDRWLEVKERQRDGRTVKVRVRIDADVSPALLAAPPFGAVPLGVTPARLVPVLTIQYDRITLVAKDRSERVTIDRGLRWVRGEDVASAPGRVLVELKQRRRRTSPAWQVLRDLVSMDESISKYCLGVVALIPGVPPGLNRHQLRRLGAVGTIPLVRRAALPECA